MAIELPLLLHPGTASDSPGEAHLSDAIRLTLEAPLDKRNFRKKILGMELLRDTGKKTQGYPIAELFRFDQAEYERLTKLGFNFEI